MTINELMSQAIVDHKNGNWEDAIELYTNILRVDPNHPDANHNFGLLAISLGQTEEALPFLQKAYDINPTSNQFKSTLEDAKNKLELQNKKKVKPRKKLKKNKPLTQDDIDAVLNLYSTGQLNEAYNLAKEITEVFPKIGIGFNLLGAILKELGKLEQSCSAYRKLVKLEPNNAKALNNLAILLSDTKKTNEAITVYKKSISLEPNYFEPYKNISILLTNIKRFEEAVVYAKQAISLNPNEPGTYNTLGIVFNELEQYDEAITNYKKAISLNQNIDTPYNNLAIVLNNMGRFEEALSYYKKAISINANSIEAYYGINLLLKNLNFTNEDIELEKISLHMLDKPNIISPRDIMRPLISLIKLSSKFKVLAVDNSSLFDLICKIQELPLLLKLMKLSPILDLEIENLLVSCRLWCLQNLDQIINDKDINIINFLISLSSQCFINEYIYQVSEDELIALKELEVEISDTVSKGETPQTIHLLIMACYKPLYKFNYLYNMVFSTEIEQLQKLQVQEPEKENNLRKTIPKLKKIEDPVSFKVQEQYETNPYPRWINIRTPINPITVSELQNELKLDLSIDDFDDTKELDILIAGCGTGQQSITAATFFTNSQVLAVDLSLSSLSYAKRKTQEMNVNNIEYMHADILDLRKLNKKFDIIECMGVLHHMNSPLEGWKVLVDCLQTEGLMKIGLYSEYARQHIVKIRSEIKNRNLTDDDIINFRNELIQSKEAHHKLISSSSDFYSFSEIKDLIFHVQEHRFTIPKIIDALDYLGLKFCGFDNKELVNKFQSQFPDVKSLYDLNKWNIFEQNNPNIFSKMYQFYCQKIS